MKFLLTRAKSFHKPDGQKGAPDSIVTLSPGEVEAPEWIRETNTYRAGVADGSIRDFAPKDPTFFVPTKAQLVDRGYASEVADEIIARQTELSEQCSVPQADKDLAAEKPATDLKTLGLESNVPEPVHLTKAQLKAQAKRDAKADKTAEAAEK